MQINKRKMPIRQEKELEDYKAKAEDLTAKLDYVAMMADVELPEEEENANVEEV